MGVKQRKLAYNELLLFRWMFGRVIDFWCGNGRITMIQLRNICT